MNFFFKEKKYIFKNGEKVKIKLYKSVLKGSEKNRNQSVFSFLTVPPPKKHEKDINHKHGNQVVVIFVFTLKSQV